jgi:hypothetical protein
MTSPRFDVKSCLSTYFFDLVVLMGEDYFPLSYHLITLLLCSCDDLDLLTILKVLFFFTTIGLVLLLRELFNLLYLEENLRSIRRIF